MSEEIVEFDICAAHIVCIRHLMNGRPFIAGSSVRVQDIYVWHEMIGMTVDEIAELHDLSLAQIYAALAYAHDQREKIEHSIEADQRMGRGTPTPSRRKSQNPRRQAPPPQRMAGD